MNENMVIVIIIGAVIIGLYLLMPIISPVTTGEQICAKEGKVAVYRNTDPQYGQVNKVFYGCVLPEN